MLHINRYSPQFKTHIKLASKTPVDTAETKLRAWPIGAAVNQHKKDMTVKSMSPENPPGNTTGRSTGVQSSIPPTSKSVKFTKFPMVNFTSSGVSGMGKTAAENTGNTDTPLSPPPPPLSSQTTNTNAKTLINAGIGTGVMANIGNLKELVTNTKKKVINGYFDKMFPNLPKEHPNILPNNTLQYYKRGLRKILTPYGYKGVHTKEGYWNLFSAPDKKHNLLLSPEPNEPQLETWFDNDHIVPVKRRKYQVTGKIYMPATGTEKNLGALAHEAGHHLVNSNHPKLYRLLTKKLPKAAPGLLGAQLLNDSVGRLVYGDKTADKMSAPLAIGGTIAASGQFMNEAIASGYGAGALMRSSKWWRPRGVKRVLNTFRGVPTYLSAGMLVPGAVYAGSKFLRNRVNKTLEQSNTDSSSFPKTASISQITPKVTLDQMKDVMNTDGSLNREGFLRLKQENPEGAERVLKSHMKRVIKNVKVER